MAAARPCLPRGSRFVVTRLNISEVYYKTLILKFFLSCITLHADFNYVCLHRGVFTVTFYVHRHRYEDIEVPADEILFLCLV